MKKTKGLIAVLCVLIICFIACLKGHEDLLQHEEPTGCDTTNVSYQTDVLPIISSNCYSCHGDGETDGGVNLDGYENLEKQAGNGSLVGVIEHANGFDPMPLNQPKLSECDINIIAAWANAGSPNN